MARPSKEEIDTRINELYWDPEYVESTDDPRDLSLFHICKLLSLLIGTGKFAGETTHDSVLYSSDEDSEFV